ncbi:MAG: hypothetical protein NUV50_08955 [Rhodospirillales bacterium]|nr:hypothetical protein [Rhodospirillales bacterium]
MMKKLAIGLGLIVVVLAIGIYYLAQNAGRFVEAVIEEQGSRVTQVNVALDGVDISLADLKAGLRGLTIANPSGFKTPRAVNLGEISVKLGEDWSPSLIVVDEVMVRNPEVTYEIGADGSNIAAIQKNVEDFMRVVSGGKSSEPAPADDGSAPKIVINDLYIKGGKVNVSSTLLQGKVLPTPLPEIHLSDIGKKSGGASPAEVVDQVISAITKSAGSAAGSLDLSQLGLADISGTAAEMGKAAKDAAEKAAQDALQGVGGATGGAVEGAAGAVKGLFGK